MNAVTLIGGLGAGLTAGSIVLARVSKLTRGSILAPALWHTAYNLTSATEAGHGAIAATTTACTMFWAASIVFKERRFSQARSDTLGAKATSWPTPGS